MKLHGDYEWQDPKSPDDMYTCIRSCSSFCSISQYFLFTVYLSVNITYVGRDGTKTHVKGKVGDNVMYLAHRYKIPIEGELWIFHFVYMETQKSKLIPDEMVT